MPKDLVIVGGGPAGLCAAINAASEGLSVLVLDSGPVLGGQAQESHAIENYPGFPEGITGKELMNRLVAQALKFGVEFHVPVTAGKIEGDRIPQVVCDDYECHHARAVLLAMGVQYKRLNVPGCAMYTGNGVYYGLPEGAFRHTKPVAIVGGANSAGQAALALAKNPKRKVYMFVRSNLEKGMSTYLISRINALPNIEVCEGCEIAAIHGDPINGVKGVTLDKACGGSQPLGLSCIYVFIGAAPKTLWLRGTVDLDEKGFIRTVQGIPYMTSIPGVFAAGDVRADSIKRIAAGVGEGAAAVQAIHQYFAGV